MSDRPAMPLSTDQLLAPIESMLADYRQHHQSCFHVADLEQIARQRGRFLSDPCEDTWNTYVAAVLHAFVWPLQQGTPADERRYFGEAMAVDLP